MSTSHCSPQVAQARAAGHPRSDNHPTAVAMHSPPVPYLTGARCGARAPQRRNGSARVPPRPRPTRISPSYRRRAPSRPWSRRAPDARQLHLCMSALGARDQTAMPARFGPVLAAVVDGRSWTGSPAGSCLLTVVIQFVYVCAVCVGSRLTADPRSGIF